jgi:hypothetical protein
MSVYSVDSTAAGVLITAENREMNIMVLSTGATSLVIAKDQAGASPLFKIPAGIASVAFTQREDLCGPLWAISGANMAIVVNTWR